MKILTTLFLLFLTVNYTLADEKNPPDNLREYDVEIILFEDAHASYINNELWTQNKTSEAEPLIKLSRKSARRGSGKTSAPPHKNTKSKILRSEYKRINNSSNYKVLLYSAWRQAGLKEKEAFEINVNELKNLHKSRSENTIAGHFKLVLARYLHIYAQLDYQRPDYQSIATENYTAIGNQSDDLSDELTNNYNIFPMKIHRRMRSKELHYIDHPLVGMLIQINPVDTGVN